MYASQSRIVAGGLTFRVSTSEIWSASAGTSGFKIDPPKFLTVPIKNDIPIRVEMTWQPQ